MTDTPASIALIDESYEYSLWTDKLRQLVTIRDDVQFAVGDEIKDKATRYAEKTIETIADDINLSAKTLYAWKNMAAFFPVDARTDYKQRGLSYSHLREAYKLGNLPDAREFLEDVILNAWTVYGTQMAVKELKGKTVQAAALFKGEVTIRRDGGRVYIESDDIYYTGVEDGQSYQITIKPTL